jgi:ISXO2 transposase-like protein
MTQSKKGMSALQIHRQIGSGDYRTAWYLCHRIRAAMKDGGFAKLMGEVEVDETYIGGSDKNRHWDKKRHVTGGSEGKTAVVGAIARKGNVICQIIENADRVTLNEFIRKTVDERVSLVSTDESQGLHVPEPRISPRIGPPRQERICARERPYQQPGKFLELVETWRHGHVSQCE